MEDDVADDVLSQESISDQTWQGMDVCGWMRDCEGAHTESKSCGVWG